METELINHIVYRVLILAHVIDEHAKMKDISEYILPVLVLLLIVKLYLAHKATKKKDD